MRCLTITILILLVIGCRHTADVPDEEAGKLGSAPQTLSGGTGAAFRFGAGPGGAPDSL
jgi:hypothetical protein